MAPALQAKFFTAEHREELRGYMGGCAQITCIICIDYTTLYKGLEPSWILISMGHPGTKDTEGQLCLGPQTLLFCFKTVLSTFIDLFHFYINF